MTSGGHQYDHLIPDLKAAVPADQLARYQSETCINGDLDYKLPQLLAGAANDAVKGRVVERALHVIDQCLLLRDVLRIDSILSEDYFPADLVPLLERWSCLSVVGDDVRGNTVIFFNLKAFDHKEYAKVWAQGHQAVPAEFANHPEFSDPNVVNYCSLWYVRMMQWIHAHRFGAYKSGQVAAPKVVMILNIDSIGISTYSTELKHFLKGIKILGGYLFPEICDYIFAANVPWVADRFWPLIKMVLHPATANKVDLYDKHRTRKMLPDLVKEEHLPASFGGVYEPETQFKQEQPHAAAAILTSVKLGSPSTQSSDIGADAEADF